MAMEDRPSRKNSTLDHSGGEMSTCLMEVSGDSFSTSGEQRMRFASVGPASVQPTKSQQNKSTNSSRWNSWTGRPSSVDNRHLGIWQDQSGSPDNPPSSLKKSSINSASMLHPMPTSYYKRSPPDDDAISHRTSMTTSLAAGDDEISMGGGRVIDEDYRISSIQKTVEFENLTSSLSSYGWNSSTSRSLEFCKKYNLRYYNILLTVIGWKKFNHGYNQTSGWLTPINILYPVFIFLMIVFACVAQILSCFGRDRSLPPSPIVNNSNFSLLTCDEHIVTAGISSYIFILASYIGGFYIFRLTESEHLSSLTETVFLSFNFTSIHKSRNRPVFVLLALLIYGCLWLMISFGVSMLRLYALDLNKKTTIIGWYFKNSSMNGTFSIDTILGDYKYYHYSFVSMAMVGFEFFDLLYMAVTINFCYQCQLLKYYIENIIEKVQDRKYKSISAACKEIYQLFEYLRVLNGKVAFLMSLVILVFLTAIIDSYQNLRMTNYADKENIALGFLNLFQWLSIAILPFIMATQFTAAAKSLRRLGIQIASRPFVYSETSPLELQYFLNFAESTRFSVKIANIPMHPPLVMGLLVILVLMVAVGIGIPRLDSVPWF